MSKKNNIRTWFEEEFPQNIFSNKLEILDKPINEQIPDEPEDEISDLPEPGIPGQAPETPEPPAPTTQVPPGDEGQEGMPDMGPVSTEQEPEDFEVETQPTIDFEEEKINYMNLAIQNKHEEMVNKLLEMREMSNLSSGQYKFIEDNLQILSLARDVDFASARKKIYKRIKDEIANKIKKPEGEDFISDEEYEDEDNIKKQEEPDFEEEPEVSSNEPENAEEEDIMSTPPMTPKTPEEAGGGLGTAPATPFSAIQPSGITAHAYTSGNVISEQEDVQIEIGIAVDLYAIISEEIERFETITNSIIKLPNFYSLKNEMFRKIICALCNGVQISSGGTLEDIFIPIFKNGSGLKVCTRSATSFGNIEIGKWNPQFNDPELFLSKPELNKLQTGSPEEKDVLRKRIIIESISNKFNDRLYIIVIVNQNNGIRKEIGINFDSLLKSGWQNGILSPEFHAGVGQGDAALTVNGEFIDLQIIGINYIKTNSDELDEEGLPVKEKIEFAIQKDGRLYITIKEEDFNSFVQDISDGVFYSEKPFDKDQKQLKDIMLCTPDIKEILLKKC